MTLHWWMHWFWVTFFHSVVALPLLLPGTFSIPSLEGRHDIQPPLNAPPTSPGDKVSPRNGLIAERLSLEKKVAAEISHDPIAALTHKDNNEDSPEGSVISKEYHSLAKGSDDIHDYDKDSASEPEKESFLEEESQREWRLDDPAPRQPLFLQSPELSELYHAVEENEDLQPSDGMPWLPPVVPHAEDVSSSQLPTVEPSHLPPSSTEEPWPEKRNVDDSSADAVRVREGKAISISHIIEQQPKQEQQKQVEVAIGGELTASTTMRPTKIEVESSPEMSSSELNSTVVVEKEDKVAIENITQHSTVPADSSSVSDKKNESDLNPLTERSKENDEGKVVIGPKLEEEVQSKKMNDLGSPESDSEKLTREEDTRMEVPTAVAVREGGMSVGDVKSDGKERVGGESEASVGKEATITTAADVPPSVQQGRMTAPKSLDAASIVGISLGSVLLVGAVAGGVGFVLYRRSLYANKPQTLNDKCSNPDSSGYIDDTLRVSSAPQRVPRPKPRSRVEVTKNGGHGKQGGAGGGRPVAVPPREGKENSEEMYSLDNDSFLNSLEAMTIQNYWTDSVKHTKL